MATLPMTKQASSKAVREAVITLPSHAAPEQHFKATQLAVCQRPLQVTNLSVWIDLLPGHEVYIGLEFQCQFLPTLISPHVTIGKFTYIWRENQNQQAVWKHAVDSARICSYFSHFVTLWWWLQLGSWSCNRFLLALQAAQKDCPAIWFGRIMAAHLPCILA